MIKYQSDGCSRGVPNLKAERKNERKKSGKERETERLRDYRRNKNERD